MTPGDFRDNLTSRLAGAGLSLSSSQIELLAEYWRLLERWNSKINLTALPLDGTPAYSIDRLIVEPLAGAPFIPQGAVIWFDLGSGGGSPAVPLKVASPAANLTMVESRSRKGAFLREVVRTLGLVGAEVVVDRFEDVAVRHPSQVDCITVRAVRADKALSDTALRLLRPSGRMILFEKAEHEHKFADFSLIKSVPFSATGAVVRVVVPRGTKH